MPFVPHPFPYQGSKRRLDILWGENEIHEYDDVKQRASDARVEMARFVKEFLRKNRDGGDESN